jgi:hypothetical protein
LNPVGNHRRNPEGRTTSPIFFALGSRCTLAFALAPVVPGSVILNHENKIQFSRTEGQNRPTCLAPFVFRCRPKRRRKVRPPEGIGKSFLVAPLAFWRSPANSGCYTVVTVLKLGRETTTPGFTIQMRSVLPLWEPILAAMRPPSELGQSVCVPVPKALSQQS